MQRPEDPRDEARAGRVRRPLSQRGGAIEPHGEPSLSRVLAEALQRAAHEPDDDLTHGFHAHPARMHPAIARHLIDVFSRPGDSVLDPFVGSGTVVVEAMLADRRAIGVELDPLALRIAELRCELRDRHGLQRLGRALREVAAASEARVRARAAVTVKLPQAERGFYDPHVLLELSGLWDELSRVAHARDRRLLQMVFSSLVVKLSRQRAETSEELVTKRIRKGLPTELFVRKGDELLLRLQALADAAPARPRPVTLLCGDARQLPLLLGPRTQVQLVVSSPPYGGTYDYASHHARRRAWLRLPDAALRRSEVGARRTTSRGDGGARRWERELSEVLRAVSAVLAPGGWVALLLGDAHVAGRRVFADEQLARLAPARGLALRACASQQRSDFHGGAPRREHLLLLSREGRGEQR